MLGKNRRALDFLYQLQPVLLKRYGGKGEGYTQAQIDRTFEEEKLNGKFLNLAYLAFLSNQSVEALDIPQVDVEQFNKIIAPASASGGAADQPIDSFIDFGDAGGFGGDAGGGGGE